MYSDHVRSQMQTAAGVMELELRQHKIIASVKPLEDGDSAKCWNFACTVAMGTKAAKLRGLDEEISTRLHADGAQVFRRRGAFIVSVAKPRNLWRPVLLPDLDAAMRRFRVALRHAGQIPVGIDVLGEPVIVDLAEVAHLGVVGISGSGKTTLLHHLLTWLARHNDPAAVRLGYACLDKPEDVRPFLELPHMAIEPAHELDHVVRTLLAVEELMRDRQRIGESRPRLVMIVDEVQDLLAQSSEADELLDAVGRRGRSAGITLVLGSQRATMAGLSRAGANIGAVLIGKTRSAADGAYALGHSTKETGGIKPHQLLGTGDFVMHQSGQTVRFQAPLLRRRDYLELPRSPVEPDWLRHDDLPTRETPERSRGGWNRAEVDEEAIMEAFRDGASVNSVMADFGIGWKRAKALQEVANESDGNDSDDADGDAGDPGDPGAA